MKKLLHVLGISHLIHVICNVYHKTSLRSTALSHAHVCIWKHIQHHYNLWALTSFMKTWNGGSFESYLNLARANQPDKCFCYMFTKVFHLETWFQSYIFYVVVLRHLDVKVKAAILGAVFLIVSKVILLVNSMNILFYIFSIVSLLLL